MKLSVSTAHRLVETELILLFLIDFILLSFTDLNYVYKTKKLNELSLLMLLSYTLKTYRHS